MSLISDALRKARQEAAEREAKERGLDSPMVAGYWSRGGHLGVVLVIGAAIAVGAAVIGGGVVWLALLDRPDSGVTPVQAETEITPAANPVTDTAALDIIDLVSEKSPAEAVAPAPGPTITVAPANGGPVKQADVRIEPNEVVERIQEVDESTSIDDSDSTEVVSGNEPSGEYIAEAQVGDITLTLDYLLYRAENPFAQINGRDVRVGSVIEDFVVEEITEDSVVLARDETRIVLRVR